MILLPVLLVVLMLGLGAQWWSAHQADQARDYLHAEVALEAGDFDSAALSFRALGGYRDSNDRLDDVQAAAEPVWQALDEANTAIEAGDYPGAIALLEEIVTEAPEFSPARDLLESARATRIAWLTQHAAASEANRDWLAAELALRELVLLQPDNSSLQEQLANLVQGHAPIAFARDGAIYIVGPDGEDERRLTPAMGARFPSWSPDRSQIAFIVVEIDEEPMNGTLMLMRGDGSDLRSIAEDVLPSSWPIWSPNGRGIAFSSVREFDGDSFTGSISLNVYEIETGIERNLTGDQLRHAVLPSWSPDNSQIVFVSNLIQRRNGGGIDPLDGDIYSVPTNGGPVRNVTQNRVFDDWWVQWSPTGERLLMLTSPGDWSAPAMSRLFLLDLASDEIVEIPVEEWQLSLPFWSPDGKKIAYVTGGDTLNIWSDEGTLTVPLGSDVLSFVTWSPDGRDLLVPAIASVALSYVVRVDGGVTSFELGYNSMSGANGPPIWGGITPSGAP